MNELDDLCLTAHLLKLTQKMQQFRNDHSWENKPLLKQLQHYSTNPYDKTTFCSKIRNYNYTSILWWLQVFMRSETGSQERLEPSFWTRFRHNKKFPDAERMKSQLGTEDNFCQLGIEDRTEILLGLWRHFTFRTVWLFFSFLFCACTLDRFRPNKIRIYHPQQDPNLTSYKFLYAHNKTQQHSTRSIMESKVQSRFL